MTARARGFVAPLVVLLALATLLVLVTVPHSPTRGADADAVADVHAAVAPWQVDVARWVSRIGAPTVWQVLVAAVTVASLLRRRWRQAALVAGTLVCAQLTSTLLKVAVGRHRPTVPDPVATALGSSFPSGHATAAAAAVGALVVLHRSVSGRWSAALCTSGTAIVLLVGTSRVCLAVHYPTDVLAGWLLGLFWLLVWARALRPGCAPDGRTATGPRR